MPAPASPRNPPTPHPPQSLPPDASHNPAPACEFPSGSLRPLLPRLPQTQSSSACESSPHPWPSPHPATPKAPRRCPRSLAPATSRSCASLSPACLRETPYPNEPPAKSPDRYPLQLALQSHSPHYPCASSAPPLPATSNKRPT